MPAALTTKITETTKKNTKGISVFIKMTKILAYVEMLLSSTGSGHGSNLI
jgi:hypothetical protein